MLKGAALKLMYRSLHARIDDGAVVQCPPGGVRSGLKVGWEGRQGEAVADSLVLLHGTAAGPEDDHEGFSR